MLWIGWSFPPYFIVMHASSLLSRSVWPLQRKARVVRAKMKRKGNGRCEMSNRKTRRGSEGLICVWRPFLTLSPELSGGSREVRVDECLSYITIIRSASTFCFTLCPPLLPIYPIASLPSLSFLPPAHFHSSCLTDVTHSGLLISHSHTRRSSDLLVRTVRAPSAGIFFHLNLKNHLNNKSLCSSR